MERLSQQQIDRAQGCLFGQLIGDALGSLVEFQHPEQIAQTYPDGVRDMHDGGTWNTIAGQPTDDSEMALALARAICETGSYDQNAARSVYVDWLESGPFDAGNTVTSGLRGMLNFDSQANGALMRISPLGIYSVGIDPDLATRYAREDAWITHPHEVTQDANVLLVLTIADAIRHVRDAEIAFHDSVHLVSEHGLAELIRRALEDASNGIKPSFMDHQGWVLIAVQNAWYQLRDATSFEEALVDTVGSGGDTDTNAAICGALLGAVHGLNAIPGRWIDVIENCAPEAGKPGVNRPRPRVYWPNDAADLALRVLETGNGSV